MRISDWSSDVCSSGLLGIKPDCGFAIVAVGGLGRRELLPYSDLDLILLHDDMDPAVVAQVADSLWYPLWDAHIKLDHSVRTLPQALQVARSEENTSELQSLMRTSYAAFCLKKQKKLSA